jgi:hypothetical protein
MGLTLANRRDFLLEIAALRHPLDVLQLLHRDRGSTRVTEGGGKLTRGNRGRSREPKEGDPPPPRGYGDRASWILEA